MATTSLIVRFPDALYDWLHDEADRRQCAVATIVEAALTLYRSQPSGQDAAPAPLADVPLPRRRQAQQQPRHHEERLNPSATPP